MSSTGRDDTGRLERFLDELRRNSVLTPHAMFGLVEACTRVSNLARAGKATRLERFVVAEAWTDAALSLVELELPMWRPRRLVYESGEWICSLSRYPGVPIEIDETADGRHEVQPVAILLAFIEAKRFLAASERVSATSVPQVRPQAADPFCCDNFR